MDSLVTTQMLTSRDIRVLHLEPTDVCQAACPLCARETDQTFDKKQKHELTIEQLQTILPDSFIAGLEKMFMCGNYGDPAAGYNTLKIFQWFKKVNPDITIGMNTNGGIGNSFWWHHLAKVMNGPRDYVVFSIDGLEDTNHIYRKNVSWQRVMQNAETFISAGGSAHWDMLVYRHNQHQVDEAQELARSMGFAWFRAKVSKRPLVGDLEVPIGWRLAKKSTAPIDCHALKEQSIYIDAQGRVSPCCWLGSRQRDFVTDFGAIQASWTSDYPNEICSDACGIESNSTRFENQWQRNVALK